jgi:broad specificity phosphatase PhoE
MQITSQPEETCHVNVEADQLSRRKKWPILFLITSAFCACGVVLFLESRPKTKKAVSNLMGVLDLDCIATALQVHGGSLDDLSEIGGCEAEDLHSSQDHFLGKAMGVKLNPNPVPSSARDTSGLFGKAPLKEITPVSWPEAEPEMSWSGDEPVFAGHRFLLLRHGETNFNAGKIQQGSSDFSRLTEKGKQQAQEAGGFLGSMAFDRVYTSPLTRSIETLQHTDAVSDKKREDDAKVIHDLREVDLHEWEGLAKKDIKQRWPDLYAEYKGGNPADFRLPSGKYPIKELWKRADGVWEDLLFDADEVASSTKRNGAASLVFGHNGINQALLGTALGLSADVYRKFEFPNCGMVDLLWNPGAEQAVKWRCLYPSPSAWKTSEETQSELA